ncbi:hypothetical protein ACHAXN_013304 [Cyclotella atomus]
MISSTAFRSLQSTAVRSLRSSSRFGSAVATSAASNLSSTYFISKKNVPPYTCTSSPHQRTFSSMGMLPRRGYPQYTVFDQNCALSIRAQMPVFKKAGADGISVDRRGKLILEFIPRNTAGAGFAWNTKTAFSLSAEEMGLCLSQLPGAGVELSHKLHYADSEDGDGMRQLSGDLIDKVLTIEPKDGAAVLFNIDYFKDGVGGQSPDGTTSSTPLNVTLQAGEFEVVKSIFQSSIPYLLGWNATMDLATAAAISKGVTGG